MTRIICSVLAAGAAALSVAAPAHAACRYEARHEPRAYRAASFSERRHEREWGELERARRMFYRHWNGSRYERARFERWYEHRCEELRRW